MKRRMLFAVAACLLVSTGAQAGPIIGLPTNGSNCFPFGCGSLSGTKRYQQVYAASEFSEPLTINNIRFYSTLVTAGFVWPGAYEFHLSTTLTAVNALVPVFDDNVGPDDALFAVLDGGGSVFPSFTVNGTPFNYDPSDGNLLLDIFVTYNGGTVIQEAQLDFNGAAGGVFSRMHDFGSGFVGRGLVTGFNEGPTDVPEPSSYVMLAGGLLLLLAGRRRDP